MVYEEYILSMNSRVDTIRKELESLGIEKKALKTTDFSVKPDYVYDDKRRKQVFNGYLSHHTLFLKLDLNRERLSWSQAAIIPTWSPPHRPTHAATRSGWTI